MAEQCWRNGAEPQQHSISGSLLTETLFKPSAPPFQPGQIAVNGELYSGLPIQVPIPSKTYSHPGNVRVTGQNGGLQEAYVPYPPHPADLALLSENPHSKALQHVPNPSASSSSGILYAEHSPSARNSDRNYLQYPYHMDWISHSGALGSRSQSTTSLREKMLKALQRNSEFFIPMSNNQFAERRGNPSRSPRNGAGGQEVIERYQQAGQTKIEDSIRRSGLTAGLKELALERLRRNAHTADDNLPHISRSSPLEIVAPNPRRRTHIRLIEEGNRVSDSIVRECHVQSPEGHSSLPFATRVGCANEKSNARQQSMTNSESVRHHYVMRNERTNTPPAPGYPHGPSILSPLFRPEPENSSPFPPLELESSKNNVRSLTNDEPVSATINAHHQGSMDDVRPGSVNEQGLFPMAAHPKSAYEKAKAVVGVGQFTAVSQAPDNRPNQKSGDRHASKPNLVALSQLSMPNEINSREKRLIYDRVNMTNLPKRILGFRSCMDCLYSSNWLIRPCKHLICTSCASFWFDDRNQNSGRYFCGFCFAKMNKIEPVQTTKAPRIHSIAEESLGLTSKPPPRMVPRINNSRIAYDSLLSQGFASATVHNHPFVNHPPESVDMSDQSRSPPRPALGLSSNLPTSRTSLAPLGSYPEHRSTKRVMVAAGANHGFPQAAEQLETSTTEASLITGMKTASTLDAASASRLPTLDHMPVYAPSSHTAFGPYFTSPPEISIYPSQPNTLYPTHANTMYPRAGHNWIAHSNIPDVHGFPQPHGGGWHYLAPEELTLPVSLGGTFMAPAASQNQRLPGFISPPAFHSLNYPPSTVSLANGDQGQLQNFGHLQQNVASRFPLPVAEIPIDSLQQSVGPYSRSIPSIPSQTNRGSHLEHGDVVSMGHAMDPEHASGSTASVISSQVGSTSYLSGPASTFAGGTQTHDSTSKSPHGYAKSSFTPKSVAPVPVTSAVPIGSVRNQDAPLPRLISYEQACHDAPFVELVRRTKPAEWGVIKISNIPYTATKPEIYAFLGRNAKTVTPDLGCAVHIIMDRATAKTMDCFVEFMTTSDAIGAVNRFARNRQEGRSSRIGDRHVDVVLSGQEALMKAIFPKAKNVTWQGANPSIFESKEPYNTGFKGFLSGEELVMMLRHAEVPNRSPFATKCPQRTYECMISTLAKYPWWAVNHYTVKDRDVLFQTTEKMLRALANAVKYKQFNIVHERLLAEFQETSLKAPGFSEKQKTRLILAAKPSPTGVTISRIATDWPFETLVRNPNASDEMVEFYAYLFRKATMSPTMVSLAEHSAAEASNAATSLFGNIVIPWSSSKETMTFAEAASQEWAVVEALLRRLLCVP